MGFWLETSFKHTGVFWLLGNIFVEGGFVWNMLVWGGGIGGRGSWCCLLLEYGEWVLVELRDMTFPGKPEDDKNKLEAKADPDVDVDDDDAPEGDDLLNEWIGTGEYELL